LAALHKRNFGEKLGISYAAVSLIELGKTTINEKHIMLIFGVFRINENWLCTSEGEIFAYPENDRMKILREKCELT